jgi:hypothetical protein
LTFNNIQSHIEYIQATVLLPNNAGSYVFPWSPKYILGEFIVAVFNAVIVILSKQDMEIESSLVIPIFFFEKKNISLAFEENTNLSLFITI